MSQTQTQTKQGVNKVTYSHAHPFRLQAAHAPANDSHLSKSENCSGSITHPHVHFDLRRGESSSPPLTPPADIADSAPSPSASATHPAKSSTANIAIFPLPPLVGGDEIWRGLSSSSSTKKGETPDSDDNSVEGRGEEGKVAKRGREWFVPIVGDEGREVTEGVNGLYTSRAGSYRHPKTKVLMEGWYLTAVSGAKGVNTAMLKNILLSQRGREGGKGGKVDSQNGKAQKAQQAQHFISTESVEPSYYCSGAFAYGATNDFYGYYIAAGKSGKAKMIHYD